MNEQIQERKEQQLGAAETIDWLSFAGNDERKLLIVLALNDEGEAIGRTGLHNHLSELSGQDIPSSSGATWSMVEKSLTKIGAVEPEQTLIERIQNHPELVPGYRITHQGKEFGVPFAGALLQWSLNHPDISLNQVLGSSSGGGNVRAPLARFWLLYDLATTPENPKGPSMTHLAEHIKLGKTARQRSINRLVQFGVVTMSTYTEENPREFRLLQPERSEGERRWAFEKLKPETQMLYKTLEVAYEQKDTWSVDDFLHLMEELYPEAKPEIVLRARERLTHSLTSEDLAFSHLIQDLGDKPFEDGGKVALTETTQKAVMELVNIVDTFISNDQSAIENGRTQAAKILSSPEHFADLYNKAFECSNYANQDEALDEKIVGIVQSIGSSATTKTVQAAYTQETGRKLSIARIHEKLGELVDGGKLKVDVQPRSKRRQRLTGHYTVASTQR